MSPCADGVRALCFFRASDSGVSGLLRALTRWGVPEGGMRADQGLEQGLQFLPPAERADELMRAVALDDADFPVACSNWGQLDAHNLVESNDSIIVELDAIREDADGKAFEPVPEHAEPQAGDGLGDGQEVLIGEDRHRGDDERSSIADDSLLALLSGMPEGRFGLVRCSRHLPPKGAGMLWRSQARVVLAQC